MAQDYSLFNILNDYSIDLWKDQATLIRKKHGLLQMIVHPDYLYRLMRRLVACMANCLVTYPTYAPRGETWIALPAAKVERVVASKERLEAGRRSWWLANPGRGT